MDINPKDVMYLDLKDIVLTVKPERGYLIKDKPLKCVSITHVPTGIKITDEVHTFLPIFVKLTDMVIKKEESMCWNNYEKELQDELSR